MSGQVDERVRRYAEGNREAGECRHCGQAIWFVYHGPNSNHSIEPRRDSHLEQENERLRKASSSAASERAVRQAALDALEADLRRERAVLLTSRFERDNAVGALEAALAELDRLTTELVDVRASRSFIYGRRLTAPARWLRGDRRPGQEPTP